MAAGSAPRWFSANQRRPLRLARFNAAWRSQQAGIAANTSPASGKPMGAITVLPSDLSRVSFGLPRPPRTHAFLYTADSVPDGFALPCFRGQEPCACGVAAGNGAAGFCLSCFLHRTFDRYPWYSSFRVQTVLSSPELAPDGNPYRENSLSVNSPPRAMAVSSVLCHPRPLLSSLSFSGVAEQEHGRPAVPAELSVLLRRDRRNHC